LLDVLEVLEELLQRPRRQVLVAHPGRIVSNSRGREHPSTQARAIARGGVIYELFMTRMPTLFVCHGAGPSFFIDWPFGGNPKAWHPMADWLARLLETLPARPRAALVISGHHVAPRATVTTGAKPSQLDRETLMGFPGDVPDLTYAQSGDPALAARVCELLSDAGISSGTDEERGLDHGVWIPFKLCDPGASIPVVSLSLVEGFDPDLHFRIGRALRPLRDDGVLILGSGASFHNMDLVRRAQTLGENERAEALAQVEQFDAWLESSLGLPEDERARAIGRWLDAPGARAAHDTDDHIAPLFVVAGAGASDAVHVAYRDREAALGLPETMFRYG
jgi:aromatic ring-opening dioxygenase catalytic subunit (LigB family)